MPPRLAEQHSIDNVLAVDGQGNGLSYPYVRKERMPQIEAQKNINRGKIAVFVKFVVPPVAAGLAQALQRVQIHHVQAPGAQFHEHGGIVGNDPVNHFVNVRAAVKIGFRGFKHYPAAGLPFLEPVWASAHGFAAEWRVADVPALQNMFGQDRAHPGGHGAREKFFVNNLDGIAVQDIQLLDAQKILRIRAGGFRVNDKAIGKGHVFRRQFHAVFPEYALAQPEQHSLAAVFQPVPFRGPGLRLQIFVVAQKAR